MRTIFISIMLLGIAASPASAETSLGGGAVNEVGLKVLRGILTGSAPKNTIISPFSIETALAMTSAGAAGETLDEMRGVLSLGGDEGALADSLREIVTALDSAAADSKLAVAGEGRGDPLEWSLANRLFGDKHTRFREEFLSFIKARCGGELESVDFRGDAEGARRRINGWVEESTGKRILDLIPAGGVNSRTALALVNALYLKAPWREPFKVERTAVHPFHLEGGGEVSVPMMGRRGLYGHADDPRFVGVTIPYKFGDLQAVFLVPKGSRTPRIVLDELTPSDLARLAQSSPASVDLTAPKFKVTGDSIDLSAVLQKLGLKRPFDIPPGSADFSRMAARKDDPLAIGAVFHKTFVALDEAGTEAAAATAVVMLRALAMPEPNPLEIKVDRPFIFAIQHRGSGACLFLGVVVNPE